MSAVMRPAAEVAVAGRPGGAFRAAMGTFATGVAVLACQTAAGPLAVTINALVSVSLAPPILAVCLRTGGAIQQAVASAGAWTVSVLAAGQVGQAEWYATRPEHRGPDPADVPPLAATPAGDPVVAGALTWLACRTWREDPTGDHTVVYGSVVGAWINETEPEALTFFRGAFGGLPGAAR